MAYGLETERTIRKLNSKLKEATRLVGVYKKALQEIKDEQGIVCPDFELCDHRACKSSCAAWFIADKALNPEVYASDPPQDSRRVPKDATQGS